MNTPHENQRDTLKDYVQKHPNNKMAWYLLGRDYADKGEIAKAKYCFIQAGEVYLAYEDNPLPEILAAQQAQQKAEAREAANRERNNKAAKATDTGNDHSNKQSDRTPADSVIPARSSGSRMWRWTAIWLVLLFLIGPATNALKDEQSAEEGAATTEQAIAAGVTASPNHAANHPQLSVFYATRGMAAQSPGKLTAADSDNLLAPLIREAMSGVPTTLLVQPNMLKAEWVDWLKKPKVLYSVEKTPETSGAYKLSAYDKETCTCEPGDSSTAENQYNQWKAAEEQRLIVQSAVAAYSSTSGKMPESADKLTQGYPNNVLSGLTPEMARFAAALTGQAVQPQQRQGMNPSAVPVPQPNGPQSVSSANLLQHPLEIIIDKTAHRLALVSGNVILRSYPVGLGGARTPEGEFVISEKVRNPNGKDNGEFGSRGMTLSDSAYAIHGTNQPTSIGADRSLGCVRMLKGDVEELFDMVPKGTKVTIGKNLLPTDIRRSEKPFQLPAQAQETNPGKVYKWLN